MAASEGLLADLAGAILDGTPIDWDAAESSADDHERPLVARLRLVAGVAGVHRGTPLPSGEQNAAGLSVGTLSIVGEDLDTPERWGHLRVLERIGGGAFGEVYRAWDTRLDREVALKVLSVRSGTGDTHGTSIIEEGRLLARVHHPNVVTIFGADRIDGRVGLWMELVKGRTLQELVEQGHPFSVAEVVDIGMQLCDAVAAVHAAGLIHRDIKAHNVMRSENGRIKLMDFGAGREMGGRSSPLAGTPLYLAPELMSGREPSVRSDVYSLGVLLYHLLTGLYPVQACDRRGLQLAHERRERSDVLAVRPDLSRRLARVLNQAIAPDPAGRYESARAVGVDLAAFRTRSRSAPWMRAMAAAAAFLVVLWAAWEVRGRQKGGPSPSRAFVSSIGPWLPISRPEADLVKNPVIVVLPFKNLSPEADKDYFVDGLTVEILHNLAAIDGLEVRSRESSFAFKGKPVNLADIGSQLAANLFLEGSVRTAGDRLRVDVQLASVAGAVLWSEQFDRKLEDVFSIQEEIARGIVNRLRLNLGRGQRRPDIDVAGYQMYLRARELQARRGSDAVRAVPLFQEVVKAHPSFAPAQAALASTAAESSTAYPSASRDGVSAFSPDQALTTARPAALRALELDPTLAEAHAAMGSVHALDRNWAAAESSFRHALSLNPVVTTIHTDFVLSTLFPEGKLDEALLFLEAARRTDPLSLDVRRVMATIQISAGLYDQALENCRHVLAVDPTLQYAAEWCGRALVQKGDVVAGIAMLEKLRDRTAGYLGYAYAVSGRRAEAENLLPRGVSYPQREALIYAGLGDKDQAFEAVERLAALNPRRAGSYLTYPELALLRGDPRVAALRKKLGLP